MKIVNKPKKECENEIIDLIRQKSESKITVGIVGGRSISSILNKIINSNINLKNIELFLLDERYVDINDDESNYKLINETTKNNLTIHSFNFKEQTPNDYFSLLNHKNLDIIIVSSGEDGHIASLFPNHDSIRDESVGYIKVENSPKPPKTRMSATKNLIKSSKTGILLFFGKSKKEAYENFQDESKTEIECPCKILKEIKESYAFVD